ncbi:hypothetical protein B0E38_05326 [Streptomyces sp. 111WW2]|nr:hypothetical protein B0E38_05326 [Streptomyces sp. 111WW2]
MGRHDRARGGPVALHARAVGVELLRRHGRTARIPAHLGGRQQRYVAVEGRVLDGLGAQRRRGLREPRPELHVIRSVPVPPQHQAPYDVHRAGLLGHREGVPRPGGRLLGDDRRRVHRGVRPVHLQPHQQLHQRRAQRPGRPVAQRRVRRGGAQAVRHPGQPVQLGGQLVREHLVRRAPHRRRPVPAQVRLRGGEPSVPVEQLSVAGGVREQPVDVPQGVVAGRARDGPGGGQPLPVREDLLHHRPPSAARPVQPFQVRVGVGEAVGMVDAQSVDHALVQQPQDGAVRRLEHLRVLHAHADQLRDAEEAPVVQLGAGQPPPHRAVPLRVQQPWQRQVRGAVPQREGVLVVAQHVAVDPEVVQHLAERGAQHRQQQPAVLRLPVDVEPPRVGR